MSKRHFLDIHELESSDLRQILDVADELKRERALQQPPRLPQKTLAMIFDKPSTRTRVSFEVAIKAPVSYTHLTLPTIYSV